MIPFSSASTILMTPAMPLAPSRWPTLDLTDPMYNGRVRCGPKTWPIAFASMGSPTSVPVPCAYAQCISRCHVKIASVSYSPLQTQYFHSQAQPIFRDLAQDGQQAIPECLTCTYLRSVPSGLSDLAGSRLVFAHPGWRLSLELPPECNLRLLALR